VIFSTGLSTPRKADLSPCGLGAAGLTARRYTDALNSCVGFNELMTGSVPCVIRPLVRPALRHFGPGSPLAIVKASGAATNNALGVVEFRLPAEFSPPPHIHHNEDEAFYLLSGRIEAQLGDQKIPAEPGAFLWLPRNVLHGFVVSADGPCTLLTITTPAGFERFVADVGTPTTSTAMPEPREPDIPRLIEVAAQYGIDFPPPPDQSPVG